MVPRIPCAILLPLLQLNKVGGWTMNSIPCLLCLWLDSSVKLLKTTTSLGGLSRSVLKFLNLQTEEYDMPPYHSPLWGPDPSATPPVHAIATLLASDKGISDIPSLTLTQTLSTTSEILLQQTPLDKCAKNLDQSRTPNTWKENR